VSPPASSPIGATALSRLRRALLRWYRENRRDLPWRRTRDPYAIWLSEAMLQQTRVETVIPYWERFLARFPSVEDLAQAPADEVMQMWAGLGYYSRARNLHAAARQIAAEHGGELPADPEGLRALPGVGRYTAGAVASIAFDLPEPILDGNVIRVLTRLYAIDADVGQPRVREQLWQESARLVRGRSPGDLNQALMELGATLCTPKAPLCPGCPLRRQCRARLAGNPEALPRKRPKAKPRKLAAVAALFERTGKLLAVRRPPEGLLGGLWELPGGALQPGETPEEGLARALREGVGLEPKEARACGEVKHVFTHRVLRLHVFRAAAPAGRVRRAGFDAHRWLHRAGLEALPLSALARKAVARAFEG